ncbi:Aste57867_11160 [Aphanomyces stellatus]|uniref:Aste57867_11160 protein n=1 Tax=Aphanomyces stellatus TaxID=120398 RepID=A0A485KSQ8_9STRA|nr:hypothetical protein As57867_011118 [Aphanomyces stellatus]VFT88027.1 Aste57867_11160 [Aphanomyces stellatus]
MNALHHADCAANGAPALDEDEQILATFSRTQMYTNTYGPDEDDNGTMEHKGVGELYVTTTRIAWVFGTNWEHDAGAVVGYAWDMTYLSLHAISRDISSFRFPCLYCQLDVEDEVNEIRFVPQEPEKELQAMFDAFSASAALNPDEDDDDEPQGDWIYNADEVESGAREAQMAAHFDSILHVSPALAGGVAGQFDDADDEDDELL